jgi:hypothetical protein
MRNYWMRIALGALAIFVVGMIGVTLVRRGVSGVTAVAEGTGPITLPIAFVPFKLDGQKLGTIHRIKIYRSAPHKVKSVNLLVRLADSITPARMEHCILVAESFEKIDEKTTIRCAAAADTAGRDLAAIGKVSFTSGHQTFPLLMPRKAIRELTDSGSASERSDSLNEIRAQQADSIDDATEARVDSITEAAERRADSIVQAHQPKLDSIQREGRRMADSLRRR